MISEATTHKRTLTALAIACSLGVFAAQPAVAQTAGNLKCNGCVSSSDVRNGSLRGRDIRNGSIKTVDLGANAVTTGKIADGTVGTADLADDAVTSAKVLDESLTASDLAPDSVGSSELADDAVGSANVAPNSLTAGDLAPNSVGTSEIQTDGVGSSEVAANAVGSSEVATNSLPATDMSNEAGADFQGANEVEGIGTTDETVRFVNVSAPSSGRVILVASGTWVGGFLFGNVGRCSITTGTAIDLNALQENSLALNELAAFGLTRGFNVGTGTTTFRLVCDTSIGGASIRDAQLTAMFFPTAY